MSEQCFCPPQLFEVPPEGWALWVARKTQQMQPGESICQPEQGSQAEWILEELGPAWAQEFALRAALAGELTTPAAQEVRARFLAGQPLSLCPWQQEERYRQASFEQVRQAVFRAQLSPQQGKQYMAAWSLPWLRYVAGCRYEIWLPPVLSSLPALLPTEALDRAREKFIAWEREPVVSRPTESPPIRWLKYKTHLHQLARSQAESAAGTVPEDESWPVDETVRCVSWGAAPEDK